MSTTALRRQLARMRQDLELLGTASTLLPASPSRAAARVDEAQVLAAELAGAFGRLITTYRKPCGLSPEEARNLATNAPESYRLQILDKPPAEVEFSDLEWLAERDAAQSLERWDAMKEDARAEVRSGYRAAQALEGGRSSACE